VEVVAATVRCALGGDWDVSASVTWVKDLGSWSGLGGTLSALLRDLFSLEGVVVLLSDSDFSTNLELLLGHLAGLLFVSTSGDGLADSGLVGDNVLVWDGVLGGTDFSVRSSRLVAESGVSVTSSLGAGESGRSIERSSKGIGLERGTSWTSAERFWVSTTTGWFWGRTTASSLVHSSGGTNEGEDRSEFHSLLFWFTMKRPITAFMRASCSPF
jgi:hypothetical protein